MPQRTPTGQQRGWIARGQVPTETIEWIRGCSQRSPRSKDWCEVPRSCCAPHIQLWTCRLPLLQKLRIIATLAGCRSVLQVFAGNSGVDAASDVLRVNV